MKKNKNFDINLFFLSVGVIVLTFGSVVLLTQTALFDFFDLSETGQIGDTIGGVSAPVINIIGIILVYISFKSQISANKIQFNQFNINLQNQKYDRNFQVVLQLFESLKTTVKELTYDDYKGKLALNVFVNHIDESWSKDYFLKHKRNTIYSDWKFIMAEYDLISFHIESSELRTLEKKKLNALIKNYYYTKLEVQTCFLKDILSKFNIEDDVVKIINDIEKYNNSK